MEQEVSVVLTIALLCSSFYFAVVTFHGAAHLIDAKKVFDYIIAHLIFGVLKCSKILNVYKFI